MLKHEIITPVRGLSVFFNYYSVSNQLVPSHWHQHIEVLYIESGQMELVLQDRVYVLLPGDIFVINSGQIHLTRTRHLTSVVLLQIPLDLLEPSITNLSSISFTTFLPKKRQHGSP